jgi:hypothetical protein
MHEVSLRVLGVLRFFSVGLLITSLFAPFRQISAGRVRGSIKVRLMAWGDRQFSRVIGAVVRLMLITIGLTIALIVGIIGLMLITVWPFLPIAPLIGVFLMQSGVLR